MMEDRKNYENKLKRLIDVRFQLIEEGFGLINGISIAVYCCLLA